MSSAVPTESSSQKEIAHYVVTAHPPGCVLAATKCNFVAPQSVDVLIAKSGRLEVRQLRSNIASTNMMDGGDDSNTDQDGAGANTTTAADLANPFPLLFQVPIYGRISNLEPLALYNSPTSLVFFLTDRHQYGVLGYNGNSTMQHPIETHASGSVTAASLWAQGGGGGGIGGVSTGAGAEGGSSATGSGVAAGWTNDSTLAVLGKEAEAGPMVVVDPLGRCIVMHLHAGLLAIIPINRKYDPTAGGEMTASYKDDKGMSTPTRRSSPSQSCLGNLFHCRLEERVVLNITFLQFASPDVLPHICILHQDARGVQHMTTHVLNLSKRQLYFSQSTALSSGTPAEWLRKSAVDGGSAMLLSVPPPAAPAAAAAPATPANNTTSSSLAATSSTTTTAPPANSGGVIVIGQRQFTYCSWTTTKTIPVPQALYLSYTSLPPDPTNGMPRFLLGDEFGNLHLLTLLLAPTTSSSAPTGKVVLGLSLETLGSCNLSRDLCYLGQGLAYVASHLGDSQLIQIHDEPIPVDGAASSASGRGEGNAHDSRSSSINESIDTDLDMLADTTYIQVLEEYTNLGPILDFDLIPTAPPTSANASGVAGMVEGGPRKPTTAAPQIQQSQVVTCSGSSKMGSLRLIRNGIGMNEYANVEIPGISNMWSLRQTFADLNDTYLVQSFVGQTRVLGVTTTTGDEDGDEGMKGAEEEEEEEDEPFGSLEEVVLPGLESNATTLYVGNLAGDRILQITETEIRLIGPLAEGGSLLDSWSNGLITVAAANEAGQIAFAQHGGNVLYFQVEEDSIQKLAEEEMEQEVSCLNLNPFENQKSENAMDVDQDDNATPSKNPPSPSQWLAVGLWEDFTVRLLDLKKGNHLQEVQKIFLSSQAEGDDEEEDAQGPARRNRNNMMARSLCLITLDFSSASNSQAQNANSSGGSPGVNMLFVGLGDGSLISFAVVEHDGQVAVRSKKEVCLGTLRIDLVPLSTRGGGSCVLATGDRPTVIYLAGIGGGASSSANFNPKLCYSSVNLSASDEDDMDDNITRPPSHQTIAVNVAAPFYSPLLFDATSDGSGSTSQQYSLCIADETCLRLGVIDDIQKLHVTTCRLGMAPRRIVHCVEGRLFAVGCMESGIKHLGAYEATNSMGNCIRFMDDTTFDDIKRVDLDPFETILSMAYVTMRVPDRESGVEATMAENESDGFVSKPFLVVGTGYSMADEAEMTRGRVLIFACELDENASTNNNRTVRQVTEFSTNGGVLSICQFFDGTILCAINSKTMLCRLYDDAGMTKLEFVGVGHHGHILSMFVKSRAQPQLPDGTGSAQVQSTGAVGGKSKSGSKSEKATPEEHIAIVGDLMRSVSVVQYFPEHQILEEIARDFNSNWTTAIEMLTDDIYLAGEHWSNLYCLRRNKTASSEEVRCRLDVVGEYHLGEMCNKFMSGSLVMPVSATSGGGPTRRMGSPKKQNETPTKAPANRVRRPVVVTGSQTLYGSVDGSLGVILGLDGRTAAFFSTLERAMAKVIRPIGDLSHQLFRAFVAERRMHPAHGFVDGDLIESFLDMDRNMMVAIVDEMNRDGGWEVDDAIAVRRNNDVPRAAGDEDSRELSVDDVVAMVEEIAMIH